MILLDHYPFLEWVGLANINRFAVCDDSPLDLEKCVIAVGLDKSCHYIIVDRKFYYSPFLSLRVDGDVVSTSGNYLLVRMCAGNSE